MVLVGVAFVGNALCVANLWGQGTATAHAGGHPRAERIPLRKCRRFTSLELPGQNAPGSDTTGHQSSRERDRLGRNPPVSTAGGCASVAGPPGAADPLSLADQESGSSAGTATTAGLRMRDRAAGDARLSFTASRDTS
jgi:hypothetical protein